MTALAANKSRKTAGHTRRYPVPMLAANSLTIYRGAILMDNGSGLVTVGADTAGAQVLGVAADSYTTGTGAATYPIIEIPEAEFFVNDGNVTAAMIGQNCTLLDDQTVSVTAMTTNDIPVGRVLKLETIDGISGVWVAVGDFGTTTA